MADSFFCKTHGDKEFKSISGARRHQRAAMKRGEQCEWN